MATILIVDDEPFLIIVLQDQLGKLGGHTVLGAATGAEGIKLAKKKIPDLIILDMGLPDMEGLQIASSLKADEKTGRIPVLMCTGKDSVSDVDASFKLGVAGYIVKPFELKRLQDKVNEILSNK